MRSVSSLRPFSLSSFRFASSCAAASNLVMPPRLTASLSSFSYFISLTEFAFSMSPICS
nr:MAG TPA: hypothetical protein [Caudoviricetes sp.]